MLTKSMTELIRRRWRSERPFEGHSAETLIRKIKNPATREAIRAEARRALLLRSRLELPG